MTDTIDYKHIFLSDAPMMDTRAPVEFARGSFPLTQNLPLMTDDERAQVGTCYKQKGQDAAIELGHSLVRGSIKEARVNAWLAFAKQNPQGYLFCFRGGLRSQICQRWLAEAGCDYPRVEGGYKAMRRFLIQTQEQTLNTKKLVILGGNTGSAKTELLDQVAHSLDLEGMANHRGSAFGKRIGGQPPQISFENTLAVGFLKHNHHFPNANIVLEDESRLIGRLCLPPELLEAMKKSPLVLVETTLEERVSHSFENYILRNLQESLTTFGEQDGFDYFATELLQSLSNIRRRLGGERFTQLNTQMENALAQHKNGDSSGHIGWIETLLRDYYDPMYSYQIQQKTERVIFRGRPEAVVEFLNKDSQ
ncbi:tRNA 2-selenouridine(34) synthase MnmH [Teredinibacter haidensis]|uniref:tRNA 2-selenouridine(34) synthase MnmH n=1 Tax=Teredinibacter haidensis TaxID=2731755 RepID=UPI000948D791|nr:tRNA 2-selenouridine(34) synthase MnmH [Teredinibacter haidensis]